MDCQCVRVMFLHTHNTHMYFLSTLECGKLWLAVLHDNYAGFCMVHDHCNAVIVAAGDYHQRWQGKEDHARHLHARRASASVVRSVSRQQSAGKPWLCLTSRYSSSTVATASLM